ncbi:MAG: OsmC family protein [Fulvivirga sp.]|nr:OsmC family protein [Fulvivirga sp.]
MKRRATAIWKGGGKEGGGTLTTTSGVLDDTPYGFKARFENEDGKAGTNPEELIGAAHAGCFAMALSFQLGGAGYTPDELHVDAVVSLVKEEDESKGFKVSEIELDLKAKIEGIDESKFEELANNAKEGCPISKALSAVPIHLNTSLES